MHGGRTWHDYPWPWVSLTLLYSLRLWRHGSWIRKFTVACQVACEWGWRGKPFQMQMVKALLNDVLPARVSSIARFSPSSAPIIRFWNMETVWTYSRSMYFFRYFSQYYSLAVACAVIRLQTRETQTVLSLFISVLLISYGLWRRLFLKIRENLAKV